MLQQSIALGPMGFSIHQLLIGLAFLLALLAGALLGRRHRVAVSDTLFTLLLVALVGARLVFVLHYWGEYEGLLSRLDIRDGGFDIVWWPCCCTCVCWLDTVALLLASGCHFRVPYWRAALSGA